MSNPYNSKLKVYSRNLRKNSTPGERILWYKINRQQLGVKFRRQHAMLNYIVDFYCIQYRLAIEVDGASHDENKYDYDRKREKDLEAVGVRFVRFTEYEVRNNINNVIASLSLELNRISTGFNPT